ncbi:PIN/TRAM domain-containing protein [Aureliella helgolandensis]|uniref:Putative PIN and TRAM-domain containing protein n=1 Tax=Aureliella helgolandensis TaxID=2527968 RepID=A0A518G8Z3_9BACT|nr:PIN domain-containing protein [Aureliella helgolandensis]QDV25042.1 putative PIN and TRAM-domain containing protein precursor [Aureliella helgolandensis]
MALLILRVCFICVAAGIATLLLRIDISGPAYIPYLVIFGSVLMSLGVIAVDIFTPRKQIEVISGVYFGLLVGVLMTYILYLALAPLIPANSPYTAPTLLLMGSVLCYACTSLLLQTKDDFRFVIPYVEFARDLKGLRPIVLDTSAIIDGRLAEFAETNIIESQLVMPGFVLAELQAIADSNDRLRRARGRRGLDILNRLRTQPNIEFQIYDRELPEFAGQPVDMKLVILAKHLEGKIITGDFNLNKVAKVHNVAVVNLNEIAASLRPQFLPGEAFEVRVVKAGEGPEQGIGYLDDGTMVVIEGGRHRINATLPVVVTSTLQTQAGRMLFAKVDDAAIRSGA